jgi:transcriptional regulator with XRE-family HTH domain
MTLAEEVKKLRDGRGLSQMELAKAIGVNQSFVSKVERGERPGIGADVLYRLCDALGVGCDHFRQFLAPPGDQPPAPPPAKPRGRPKKAEPSATGENKKPKKSDGVK